jgi:hypothetical protein
MTIDSITKGLVTKAAKNHDGGIAYRALRRRIEATGTPRQQAKHLTRKLIAARG